MQAAYSGSIEGFLTSGVPEGAFVAGAWCAVAGPEREVVDPATGAVLARTRDTEPAVVDRAVAAAGQAFADWSAHSAAQRAAVGEQVADAIAAHADILARLETRDTGKPLSQSQSDVQIAERYFRYYAHAAEHLFGDAVPSAPTMQVVTQREPYGVVAHITPWNAPISQLTRGVAPSLAVGNTVVVKPSELAPLSSMMFADIVADVLPPGVFNLVPGDGAKTGHALAAHPGIDHLTFTGSVATGVKVAQAAAVNVVAVNLELGGKSAALVFPDADLDAAATSATGAIVRNSGQSCSALTRFVVHRDVVESFTQKLVEKVSALSVGAGIDGHDVGPLISRTQLERVVELVQGAVREGATLRAGTGQPARADDLREGFFLEPMVLADVRQEMAVAGIEIFGPVQSVLSFDTLDEAVAIANATDYGLAAAVFTRDLTVATQTARQIRAGQVQINGFVGSGAEIPFGGYAHSGHGREKGFEALYGYTQVKAVVTHLPATR